MSPKDSRFAGSVWAHTRTGVRAAQRNGSSLSAGISVRQALAARLGGKCGERRNQVAKPKPSPFTSEISRWLKQVRKSWFGELKTALSMRSRFLFAAVGAGLFSLYHEGPQLGNLLLAPEASQALGSALGQGRGALFFDFVTVVIVVWTGVIVAWRERKSGPIRLFFDGILVPTGAAAILRLGQ